MTGADHLRASAYLARALKSIETADTLDDLSAAEGQWLYGERFNTMPDEVKTAIDIALTEKARELAQIGAHP